MPPASDLAIIVQPAPLWVTTGASATFTIAATATGAITYQWFLNGEPIGGANAPTYTIASASFSDAGQYSVDVSSGASRIRSDTVALSVADPGVVTASPADQTVTAGSAAVFSVAATGAGLSYQWLFDGVLIAGATASSYTVSNAGVTEAGVYTVDIWSSGSLVAADSARLTVTADARLANLSIRGFVDDDQHRLIVGLAIGGTGQKQVLLRAVGPSLAMFGVTGVLPSPVLTLYRSDRDVIATNAGWGGTAALANAFAQVGAFALPANSADSALLESLAAGPYTAMITGANDSSGIALAEIYDADTGFPTAALVNLSARAYVADGLSTLIAGFVIEGKTSETLLIRGVGPTLGGLFGIGDALKDTKITLVDSAGRPIASNAGWDGDPAIDQADDRVGAFHFMNRSLDSALLVTLPPGTYTVELTGDQNGESGTGLLEIYQIR